MGKSYKPITSMKEVPEQLRKLRRQYLRYQQAEMAEQSQIIWPCLAEQMQIKEAETILSPLQWSMQL